MALYCRRYHGKKYNQCSALCGAGGVLQCNGSYVKESAQLAYGMKNRIEGSYCTNKLTIKRVKEEVIYMNFFIHQWGHFLLDVIGRLWWALQHKEYKIIYTCYTGKEDFISGNYLEFLNLLGINEDRLFCVNEVMQFEKVIIPESSIYPGKYYTVEYKAMFDCVIDKVNKGESFPSKVYLSRRAYEKAKSKENGEDILETIFLQNEFHSVYMEKMKLAEQIKLLNSVKEIAMTSGTLAHNLLFIKSNPNVYIINKTYRVNIHQFMVNQMSSANVTFVDAYVSPLPVLYGYGPFLLRITKELICFCKNTGLVHCMDISTKLTCRERFLYYVKWGYTYKHLILKGNKIYESENSIVEKEYQNIRKYFKEQQIVS